MAKIEARVRDFKKSEGDDMLADFKLTAIYRRALTAEQREKVKTLSPKFEPYMSMPGRPGMPGGPPMPGGPGMVPGGPGNRPNGNPFGEMGGPGNPPPTQPTPPPTPPQP